MSDEFRISQLLHATVLVSDIQRSLAFYRDLLGMTVRADRPDLGYPGVWLDVGDVQIHLMELPNPDPISGRPTHGGQDRHIALAVNDIETCRRRLEGAGVTVTMSRSGRAALFCRDPDGNALEFAQC